MSASPLRLPSFTAVVSLIFAVTGFSYNAWRLEQSEENNIVRENWPQVSDEMEVVDSLVVDIDDVGVAVQERLAQMD